MKITYDEKLMDFLRKHRLVRKFKKNTVDNFVKNNQEEDIHITDIIAGFVWGDSPEGDNYWRLYYYKFKNLLI